MAYGRRRRRCRGSLIRSRSGQSTLEYMLVLLAFMAMVCALALVWHAARDGRLLALATGAASHGAGQGAVALLKDVAAF